MQGQHGLAAPAFSAKAAVLVVYHLQPSHQLQFYLGEVPNLVGAVGVLLGVHVSVLVGRSRGTSAFVQGSIGLQRPTADGAAFVPVLLAQHAYIHILLVSQSVDLYCVRLLCLCVVRSELPWHMAAQQRASLVELPGTGAAP